MAKAHKLTHIARKGIAKGGKPVGPGMHGDGAGLWLKVTDGGSSSWILRYTFDGRERWMGLGPYPDVGLAEARERASDNRSKVRQGIDPLDERHANDAERRATRAKAVTFDWCASKYIEAHAPSWSNPKHIDQWRNTIATYASPTIGALDVSRIDTGHITKVLEPIWTEKAETASRLRGRLESILDWAAVRKYRKGDNPARWKGHLDTLLAKQSRTKRIKHHPALPWPEVGHFMTALRKQPGVASKALELTILTAARSGEIRGAIWSEFDLNSAMWIVPAERMKAGKEHRVPLSEEAVKLLKALDRKDDGDLVFPGARAGRPLSDMSLTAVLRRMERHGITVHGFRSTFRDWAAETTNYPREMAEMALAHTVSDKVEAAYRRGDMLEKRRHMMQAWAKHCGTSLCKGRSKAWEM
ncbi:tyrosine-type recombinase/integrase [Nitrogeniibacter aestuarii]|uniref:tyrosine-type recombinase/integrase n=1 Tax=Nitrogeniibacter aestuarii TaxID=2815343 RepID=UPI001D11CA18|nr:site-specific integrase [Nitrogeniibacter aestuarii]